MNVGIVMDPIQNITIKKDTSFAMLLEAQRRGHTLFYMEPKDIWLREGETHAHMRQLTVEDNSAHWFKFGQESAMPLTELDVLLMRKDPPFDMQYVYLTYLLEIAEAGGLRVINKPSSLRDANEKVFTSWFPQCCPETLISSQIELLRIFALEKENVVVKPLGAMGGQSIFRLNAEDPNLNVILETMTKNGSEMVMAQRFVPEITSGDKRILLINGEPVQYALARIPAANDFRGNIASGARTEGVPLTDRDRWICKQVGPTLAEKGLIFVGLDVIGDYLTEVNVTSPTCVRELDALYDLNIASDFFDCIDDLVE